MTDDPDAILADRTASTEQKIRAAISIAVRDLGERWAWCLQCGRPYRVREGMSGLYCSPAHARAHAPTLF